MSRNDGKQLADLLEREARLLGGPYGLELVERGLVVQAVPPFGPPAWRQQPDLPVKADGLTVYVGTTRQLAYSHGTVLSLLTHVPGATTTQGKRSSILDCQYLEI